MSDGTANPASALVGTGAASDLGLSGSFDQMLASSSELTGATEADLERHAAARVALLSLVQDHPEVRALFARWDAGTPFGRAATALGVHLRRFTAEDGYPSVGALLGAARAAGNEHTARFRRVIRDPDDLLGAYADALEAFDLVPLYREACRLVCDWWHLPWPWVAEELVAAWGDRQLFGIWGEAVRTRFALRHPAPVAPPIAFATKPGESVEAAWRRCQAEVIAPLRAAATAARKPAGKRSPPEVVERYVGWWYRSRIRRESIRSIAGKVDDNRKLVKHGVTRADGWFAAATWTWADEDGGPPGNGRVAESGDDRSHGNHRGR